MRPGKQHLDRKCAKCGGALEAGSLRARDTQDLTSKVAEFSFVRPGEPTSCNPIEAFRQGMAGQPSEWQFPVLAWRCSRCGLVELYASDQ